MFKDMINVSPFHVVMLRMSALFLLAAADSSPGFPETPAVNDATSLLQVARSAMTGSDASAAAALDWAKNVASKEELEEQLKLVLIPSGVPHIPGTHSDSDFPLTGLPNCNGDAQCEAREGIADSTEESMANGEMPAGSNPFPADGTGTMGPGGTPGYGPYGNVKVGDESASDHSTRNAAAGLEGAAGGPPDDAESVKLFELMDCPTSTNPNGTYAGMKAMFYVEKHCTTVRNEILARVRGSEAGTWVDPHHAGTYIEDDGDFGLTDSGQPANPSQFMRVAVKRLTGDEQYIDKMIFTFFLEIEAITTHECRVSACSISTYASYNDFGTNYCNMFNLFCDAQDGCNAIGSNFTHGLRSGDGIGKEFRPNQVMLHKMSPASYHVKQWCTNAGPQAPPIASGGLVGASVNTAPR